MILCLVIAKWKKAAECLHVASGGESAVASGAASIRSVSQPASAPDEIELSSTTDVRQASASRLSASASRLRLFSLGSSQPLLDVSADDYGDVSPRPPDLT